MYLYKPNVSSGFRVSVVSSTTIESPGWGSHEGALYRSGRVMLRYWLRRAVIILFQPQNNLLPSVILVGLIRFNRDPYNDLLQSPHNWVV